MRPYRLLQIRFRDLAQLFPVHEWQLSHEDVLTRHIDRNLNGRIITSHVQRMLNMVESEIKRACPEHGQDWRFTFLVSHLFAPEPPHTIWLSTAHGMRSSLIVVESDPSESEQKDAEQSDY